MAQGYNARLDESLGGRHRGHHKQSLKECKVIIGTIDSFC